MECTHNAITERTRLPLQRVREFAETYLKRMSQFPVCPYTWSSSWFHLPLQSCVMIFVFNYQADVENLANCKYVHDWIVIIATETPSDRATKAARRIARLGVFVSPEILKYCQPNIMPSCSDLEVLAISMLCKTVIVTTVSCESIDICSFIHI